MPPKSTTNGKRNFSKVDGISMNSSSKRPMMNSSLDTFFKIPKAGTSIGATDQSETCIKLPSPPTLEHFLHLNPFPLVTSETIITNEIKTVTSLINQSTTTVSESLVIDLVDSPPPTISETKRPIGKEDLVKIAFCDLDGCLITPKDGRRFPNRSTDWQWWDYRVKQRLKVLHKEGFHVIIISNQKLKSNERGLFDLEQWRQKMQMICRDLPSDVPLRVLAATGGDEFRKPRIAMFDFVKDLYSAEGLKIDMSESFFVGDAAGRSRDHSDTDRKWAANCGLQFYTPEELFKGEKSPVFPPFKGFDAKAHLVSSAYAPLVFPTSTPIVPAGKKREIIVFVGFPACGKTSFFQRHFSENGYIHINQDTLKSRDKCLQAVREVLAKGTSGCVVDNTNRDKATRKLYISIARQMKVPIRCFFFTAPFPLAKHNNTYRALVATDVPDEEKRAILPDSAFVSFQSALEEPEESEGFDEVKRVNFIFEGSEDDRERWSRWMF